MFNNFYSYKHDAYAPISVAYKQTVLSIAYKLFLLFKILHNKASNYLSLYQFCLFTLNFASFFTYCNSTAIIEGPIFFHQSYHPFFITKLYKEFFISTLGLGAPIPQPFSVVDFVFLLKNLFLHSANRYSSLINRNQVSFQYALLILLFKQVMKFKQKLTINFFTSITHATELDS